MQPTEPKISIRVFISYSHADHELCKKLKEHLSSLSYSGKITIWQDQEIPAGANWQDQIDTHLNEADLILLLLSASFLASKYCWSREVQTVLERHKRGEARVLPIILRPVDWRHTPLGQLQALPTDAKPVTQWEDLEAAFEDVVRGIRKVVEELSRPAQGESQESEPEIVGSASPQEPSRDVMSSLPPKWHLIFVQLKRWRLALILLIPVLFAIGSLVLPGTWAGNISYRQSTPTPPSNKDRTPTATPTVLATITPPQKAKWQAQISGTLQILSKVTRSSSQFVAVGDYGTILTSSDGVTWVSQNSGTPQNLYGVAWLDSQFVAIGEAGTILTSPDGSKWTLRSSGTSQVLHGIAWSGSQFVVVGENGTVLTSPNGITWTPQSSGISNHLFDVARSNSQFVAVGLPNAIFTSPDGVAWRTAKNIGPAQGFGGVTWSGFQFVIVGRNGKILTSPDGNDWTLQSSGTLQDLDGIVSSGSEFVVVGKAGTILTSPDGINWTPQISGAPQFLRGIAWSGSRFVAVGDNGTILTLP